MLEQKLNELNIFALRDLARKTGIASPTSKKKDELIKGIVEIMSGNKQPNFAKTKQGRPPKMFGYDVANMFNVIDIQNSNNLTLNQEKVEYNAGDIQTVAGWLELVNNNSAILWVQNNFKQEHYFIPSNVIRNFNLKTGDRIVAEIDVDENQNVVKDIFNVNGTPISKFLNKRFSYENLEHNSTNRSLKFANPNYNLLDLKIADNNFIYGENNVDNTLVCVDILNSCEITNKIYINISLTEKNKTNLLQLNDKTEKFVANAIDDVDSVKRYVSIAIERTKRLLENGEDVLVVVDDIMSIDGIDNSSINLVKKLVSLSKECKKFGSITLFAVMPESLNKIEKLADKRFKIENKILTLK